MTAGRTQHVGADATFDTRPQRALPGGREGMRRMVAPRGIAVIGASPRTGSFGERVLHNLADFSGPVYPVNPKYTEVGAYRCHAAVSALPTVPDCAVIVSNRDSVEQSVRDCASAGIGAAIVFASGFAETGLAERIAQQQQLIALARETGIRIAGPNCMGVVNCTSGARMTFQSVIPPAPRTARAIGLVSQSGALGLGLAQASQRGVPFSHVLTCGNSCDVDVADFVDYLVDDPACNAIACTFEGMSQPLRLVAAAERAWAADKPLIIYKMATGELGTAAAASHTGSLAGSHATYRALLEQVGAVVVDDFNAFIETAVFFSKAGAYAGRGAAVLATSGGAAIVAADEAEAHQVALPPPGAAARAVLQQHVPEFGSIANPCDVTAQVLNNPDALEACADALLADPAYAALVVPHTLAYAFGLARIATFDTVARRHGKLACNVWMSEWLGGPGVAESEACESVALFRSMPGCFAALAAWRRRDALRKAIPNTRTDAAADVAAQARQLIAGRAAPHALTEREAKAVLALYGVPVTREALASTVDEAVAAADRLGYPVALKIESADIAHKTEAGVVRLQLSSREAVRQACDEVSAAARRAAPQARLAGFLVQEMLPAGIEILVGGRVDPLFGPLVVVGFGGIFVELLQDSAIARAPIDPAAAARLVGSLRYTRLLAGFRGMPVVNIAQLCDIVSGASHFIAEHAGEVLEFDINPLIACAGRLTAADALIVLRNEAMPAPAHGAGASSSSSVSPESVS